MYQNIYYSRKNNQIHLWDDVRGYSKFPYSKDAYIRDSQGTHVALDGKRVSPTKSWTDEDVSKGLVYESDVDNINMFPITWDKIRIYNDYQNTDIITLDPTVLKNIRRVERSWQLQVPRNKVLYSTSASPNIFTDLGNKPYGERMRDKTFTIELEFNNPNNYRFIMHYLKSIFRVSYK